MKTVQSHIINKQSGIQHTISHHIKSENYGVIFNILRKQLYTDLILAPIREVSANAVDAHVECGKANVPIKVTLPTQLDSFLRIRDYGTGLSDEKIAELYSGYGDSGKRNSNETIGGFGIGKFAPLAYGDSFIINSYQNGVVSSWNSYIDASNRGAMSKMGVAPSTEPDGLEIVMPVKGHDVEAFHDKAINLFAYFKTIPIIINATPEDMVLLNSIKNKTALFSNDNYKFIGDNVSKAIMGGIAYSIDARVFSDEISPEAKVILEGGIILNFNIGGLEVAASRETLNYSPYTKKKLCDTLNEVAKDLIKQGNDSFNNCKTLWDAKCLYREIFDYYGKLYALRRFFGNKLIFNGKPIESQNFCSMADSENVRINCYSKNRNSWRKTKKVNMTATDTITAHNQNMVVENDLNLQSGILNRIVGLIEGDKKMEHIYVVSFKDATIKAEWLKDTGFDGEITMISALPKEALSKYYPSTPSSNGGGIKNNKHTSKEFLFNFNTTGNSWSLKNSDYFTLADVDMENDSGVYVIIDKFCIRNSNNLFNNPDGLLNLQKKLTDMGITMPNIYGFKITKESEVLKNEKMVSLWSWLTAELQKHFAKHPMKMEQIANFLLTKELTQKYQDTCVKSCAEFFKKTTISKKNDLMIAFSHLVKVMADGNDKIEKIHNLATKVGMDCTKFKPSYDVKSELGALKQKYAMMFILCKNIHPFDIRKDSIDAMETYINLVNEV